MTSKKNKKTPPNVKKTLDILERDHIEFRNVFLNTQLLIQNIEIHSKNMAECLKGFREDNQKHLKLLENAYQNNTDHLELIAGKKQVPISIFAMVVILLCTLLVASEVRYSGLDIQLSTSGIHVDPTKKDK